MCTGLGTGCVAELSFKYTFFLMMSGLLVRPTIVN